MQTANDDYDTPWKDAVTRYFPEFMSFYFPRAHAAIDWARPYAFLEQELAQVVRDAALGKRLVDKLVQVFSLDGMDTWVLLHIDVQGTVDSHFAERMFVYNYRIYDRFRRPVASMALLADGRARWKPDSFRYTLFGCKVGIRFPMVKLSEYGTDIEQLLEHPNVFSLVTAAHVLTQQTRGQHVKRHAAKWRLARLLYDRDWDRQRIIDLFNVIDWMMRIPKPLQAKLMNDIADLERNCRMPYVSSFERLGRAEGLKEGRREGRCDGIREVVEYQLSLRFGTLSPSIRERIAKASASELRGWSKAVLNAPTLDDVFAVR
jgi:hypothetical protein